MFLEVDKDRLRGDEDGGGAFGGSLGDTLLERGLSGLGEAVEESAVTLGLTPLGFLADSKAVLFVGFADRAKLLLVPTSSLGGVYVTRAGCCGCRNETRDRTDLGASVNVWLAGVALGLQPLMKLLRELAACAWPLGQRKAFLRACVLRH